MKSEEWGVKSEEWRVKSEEWRVKSEEWGRLKKIDQSKNTSNIGNAGIRHCARDSQEAPDVRQPPAAAARVLVVAVHDVFCA